MPAGFSELTLNHLLEIPLGETTSFEKFADRMIADSRMYYPIKNQDSARDILHSMIERTLINPLADFGIVQTDSEPDKILGADFRELSTFRITPFEKGLLEAIYCAMEQEQHQATNSTTNRRRLIDF